MDLSEHGYKIGRVLGQGTYATVYFATPEKNSKNVAIKCCKLDEDGGIPSSAIREISVMKTLDHKNIVRLLDCIRKDDKICLVFELCASDLEDFFIDNKKISLNLIRNGMKDILTGLLYCHERGILHRDIKPRNIFIAQDKKTLKLGDFGMMRIVSNRQREYTEDMVTLNYRPPEIIKKEAYSLPCDIWSAGCVLAEFLYPNRLFYGETEIDVQNKILGFTEDYTRFSNCDKDAVDLLSQMLKIDPNSRITAKRALQHKFLTGGHVAS